MLFRSKKDSSLILGRSANIKDSTIKITDISPDEGRVCIEGEASNIDLRELKSGKTLISFDLYDGTGSMTCKCFCKQGESEEMVPKLQEAKGLKIIGNSSYSNFSGEVELIANCIVETKGMEKVKRMDDASVKRVELHMHTQMSQIGRAHV